MPKKGKYSILEQTHALQRMPCSPELKIDIYATKTLQHESLHQKNQRAALFGISISNPREEQLAQIQVYNISLRVKAILNQLWQLLIVITGYQLYGFFPPSPGSKRPAAVRGHTSPLLGKLWFLHFQIEHTGFLQQGEPAFAAPRIKHITNKSQNLEGFKACFP